MSSLSPLEQLAVEAFAIALETCREEGVELPEEILALEPDLEHHVGELSVIAQSHPQLQVSYRTARKMLRQQSGDRNRFLPWNNVVPGQTVQTVRAQTTTDILESNLPNLKRVGTFWIVKAVHQTNADWTQLIQVDRDSRFNTLMGLGIAES